MRQVITRLRTVVRKPDRDELVLATGVITLLLAITLLLGLPFLNRLEAQGRMATVKGNAATVQLAVESFARQHRGAYPESVGDFLAYLPLGQAPENPLSGRPVTFTPKPGDVTYTLLTGGRGYRIQAWTYGPGETCRQARELSGGC